MAPAAAFTALGLYAWRWLAVLALGAGGIEYRLRTWAGASPPIESP